MPQGASREFSLESAGTEAGCLNVAAHIDGAPTHTKRVHSVSLNTSSSSSTTATEDSNSSSLFK